LLWEAVAKSRMWPNQDRTQIMRSIIRGELPDLRDRVDVDPALGHIVSKAMARDPADRYATALEMRLALEQYMSAMRPVTAHDIGTLLRRAYGDPRSHRQHLIAEAIAKLGDEFKTHGGTDSGGTMDEGINASVTRPPPSIKPPRRVQNVLLPLVAALALIGVGWWAARAAQPAQDTNVAATSLRLERRTLTVRATPLDARVNVDGRYLEGNPASIAVAPGSEHALRVSASGYDPVERRLRVEHDTSVMLDLQPQPSAPAASSLPDPLPRGRRRPAADVRGRRPSAGSTSDEKPGCNPPYYYENGIKTYRPECI
jgi:serine/threonine-protein kinase